MPTLTLHNGYSIVIDFIGDVARGGYIAESVSPNDGPLQGLRDALIRKTPSATTKLWRDILQELPFDYSKVQNRWVKSKEGEPPADSLENAFTWWSNNRNRLRPPESEDAADVAGFLGLLLLTLFALRESERRRSALAEDAGFWDGMRTLPHDCDQTCSELVKDAAVRSAIRRVYRRRTDDRAGKGDAQLNRDAATQWERIDFDSAHFHKHGTTSIILSVEQSPKLRSMALKLLLAPFQNVDSIAEATSNYASDYSLRDSEDGHPSTSKHIVRAIASTSSWVLMEFVGGETLAEYLQARRAAVTGTGVPVPRTSEDAKPSDESAAHPQTGVRPVIADADAGAMNLEQLDTLGRALFAALIEFDRIAATSFANRYHADLSPSNIIVSQDGSQFVLIDLGPNYLYTRSIGGAAGADSIFVAPEVKAGNSQPWRADIYSVGQLLILFAGFQPSIDGVVPDVFYADAPLIAQFLEDLLDRNPENRLLSVTPPTWPAGQQMPDAVYTDLRTSFINELDVAKAVSKGEGRSASRLRPLIGEVIRPFRGEPGRQKEISQLVDSQRSRRDSEQTRTLRRLYHWSRLSAIISTLTILIVLWWLYRDMNWDWGNPIVEGFNRLVHGKAVGDVDDGFPFVDDLRIGGYDIPDLDDNWLARAAGLSYALLGAKLYQSLFARLAPLSAARNVPELRWSAIAAEINMRSVSIVNSLLVLSITLVEARFWPIASALGQTYALSLNAASVGFAKRALTVARKSGISTVPDQDVKVAGLSGYAQWVPSSILYSIICWSIGLLIYAGVLRDTWLYAATVTSINIGLFYIIKCGLAGPDIRVGLQRAVLAAERVSLRRMRSAETSRADRQAEPVR
jgi:serine/threonine protein kinase